MKMNKYNLFLLPATALLLLLLSTSISGYEVYECQCHDTLLTVTGSNEALGEENCGRACGGLTDCPRKEDRECESCCDAYCGEANFGSEKALYGCMESCVKTCSSKSMLVEIYEAIKLVVVIAAALMFALCGIFYLLSDKPESRDKAKGCIVYSIIGLVVVGLGPELVKLIYELVLPGQGSLAVIVINAVAGSGGLGTDLYFDVGNVGSETIHNVNVLVTVRELYEGGICLDFHDETNSQNLGDIDSGETAGYSHDNFCDNALKFQIFIHADEGFKTFCVVCPSDITVGVESCTVTDGPCSSTPVECTPENEGEKCPAVDSDVGAANPLEVSGICTPKKCTLGLCKDQSPVRDYCSYLDNEVLNEYIQNPDVPNNCVYESHNCRDYCTAKGDSGGRCSLGACVCLGDCAAIGDEVACNANSDCFWNGGVCDLADECSDLDVTSRVVCETRSIRCFWDDDDNDCNPCDGIDDCYDYPDVLGTCERDACGIGLISDKCYLGYWIGKWNDDCRSCGDLDECEDYGRNQAACEEPDRCGWIADCVWDGSECS